MPSLGEWMPKPAGAEPGAWGLCPRPWVARRAQKSERAVRCLRSGQGVHVHMLDFVGQTPGRRSLGRWRQAQGREFWEERGRSSRSSGVGTHGCPEPLPVFRGDTATPRSAAPSAVPSHHRQTALALHTSCPQQGFRRCLEPLSVVSWEMVLQACRAGNPRFRAAPLLDWG